MQTCIWPSCCHCHALSLASVKSRLVLPFWYRLIWVIVSDKGSLNVCVCVCVCLCELIGVEERREGKPKRGRRWKECEGKIRSFRLKHWVHQCAEKRDPYSRIGRLLGTRDVSLYCSKPQMKRMAVLSGVTTAGVVHVDLIHCCCLQIAIITPKLRR